MTQVHSMLGWSKSISSLCVLHTESPINPDTTVNTGRNIAAKNVEV